MKVSKQILKDYYSRLNSKFFDEALPKANNVEFRIDHSIHNAGGFLFKNKDGMGFYEDPVIIISDMFNWDYDSLKGILLHEMVHFYVGIKDNNIYPKHNGSFKKQCRLIKDIYKVEVPMDANDISLTDKGKSKIKKEQHNWFMLFLNWLVNKIC